jgi:hypothetical protein
MNRRGFLKSMFAVSAAGLLVPTTSYFFAPKGGWGGGSTTYIDNQFMRDAGLVPDFTRPIIGQYSDYCSMVWNPKTGRHYNLLKADDLVSARNDPDSFVRMLANYEETNDPNQHLTEYTL